MPSCDALCYARQVVQFYEVAGIDAILTCYHGMLYRGMLSCHAVLCYSMQVGKFYEAAGIDAILMAEHLGSTLMGGPEARVAKAGVPVDSLARHLRTLVREKGFEVVSDAGCMRLSMIQGGQVANAGLPEKNLPRSLRALVREKGFEVVSDALQASCFHCWYVLIHT